LVHELRNPLSSILGASQLGRRHARPDSPVAEYWTIVQSEAKLLEQFLNRLAEFGHLNRSRAPGRQRVGMADLTAQAVSGLQPEAERRGVKIVAGIPSQVPAEVYGDAAWLNRALTEVLLNGMEATAAGGEVRVTLATPGRGCAEIWVADDGPGLSPEELESACEPFFSRRPRALGLGLTLAEAILARHGGRIVLENGRSGGARVGLVLSLADETRACRMVQTPE
jgi:signal transduction histidine kinase